MTEPDHDEPRGRWPFLYPLLLLAAVPLALWILAIWKGAGRG